MATSIDTPLDDILLNLDFEIQRLRDNFDELQRLKDMLIELAYRSDHKEIA